MDPVGPPLAAASPEDSLPSGSPTSATNDDLARVADRSSDGGQSASGGTAEDGARLEDDWERRLVCANGNCVGVVGGDGRCNRCGLEVVSPSPAIARSAESAPEPPVAARAVAADDGERDDPWSRRRLCSNGACLGVIGEDERCTVCGNGP